jgi:DNA-binding NtrC family response regulator
MEERSIIIADRDVAYRGRMAGFFRKAGYRVEATGSADQVLNSIQEKQAAVLLLGSDFGSKVASADLVHLLKKTYSQLQVIMVSDVMTLAQAREVRQEGIFYHALKPATAGEALELGQAVACAFVKHQASVPTLAAATGQLQPAVPEAAPRAKLMNALSWVVGIAALILGTNYLALPGANSVHQGNSLAVWIFLGFCAMVVTGQLLPIFRIKLALSRADHRAAARANSTRGGK